MDTGELTQLLDRKYAEIEEAFQQKDFDAIERYMDPGFIAHAPEGVTKTRDQLMADLRTNLADMDVTSWSRRVTDLKMEGEEAHAIAEGVFKTSAGERMLRNEDVWEQRNGDWIIVRSHSRD